jgi:hypothetical protein
MKVGVRVVFLIVLQIVSVTYADDADEDQLGSVQLEKWSQYYQARAVNYEIRRAGDDQQLELRTTPVMRWTNLVVSPDNTQGECFVWTVNGRPEVFVSLFSYNKNQKRTVAHAFNTLSRQPLVATYKDEVFWTPTLSGVHEMKPILGAPPPADSRARRLVQMRQLARSFSARSGGTNGDKELELRLFTTPVFRYEGESEETLDGALFAFVTGTDPEVLLMIEAHSLDGEMRWHYVAARHSYLTLRVKYKGEPAWEYLRGEPNPVARSIDHTYRSQHGVDEQERLLP